MDRIALSTVCLPELDWERHFEVAAMAGYRQVELLMIKGWVHVDPAQVAPERVKAGLERYNLKLAAVHAGGLSGTSDEACETSMEYIRSVIDWAAAIGLDLVNFNADRVFPAPPPEQRVAMVRRFAEGVARLQPYLEKRRVRATVENHFQYQMETIDDYERLFERLGDTPWVGMTVDTGHFTAAGIDPAQVVKRFGDRVIHVHLKDHIGTESVAFGRGTTNNRGTLQALREVGYRGLFTVEMEVHDRPNARCYVDESFSYVQRLLDEVDA